MYYRPICALILCSVLYLPATSWALTYKQCFQQAAKTYKVPYSTLLAIAFTESSLYPNSRNVRNRNGTSDYGFMQINTLWRKVSARNGFRWLDIKNNPCTNIMFGAWILSKNYQRLGNWPHAVGAYNAGFSRSLKARKRRLAYYHKVVRNTPKARKYAYRLNKRAKPSRISQTARSNNTAVASVKKQRVYEEIYKKEVDENTIYNPNSVTATGLEPSLEVIENLNARTSRDPHSKNMSNNGHFIATPIDNEDANTGLEDLELIPESELHPIEEMSEDSGLDEQTQQPSTTPDQDTQREGAPTSSSETEHAVDDSETTSTEFVAKQDATTEVGSSIEAEQDATTEDGSGKEAERTEASEAVSSEQATDILGSDQQNSRSPSTEQSQP